MTNYVSTLTSLQHFFDTTDVMSVNRIITLMALYPDDDIRPEWLRNKLRFNDLPRISSEKFSYSASVEALRDREIATRTRWIIENLTGAWSFTENGFGFETQEDEIIFKLRWG